MIQQRNSGASILRNIDWITVLLYLLMVAAGVVSIYAASYDFDQANMFSADEFSGKQVRWIGLSFLLGLVILLIDSRMYETYAFPIYVVVMLLLLITPYVALALAKLFSGYHFILNAKFSNYVKALVIILLPVALILNQNETGSALTFMALFFVLYREGMSGLVLFAALISVVIFVVVVKFTDVGILGIPSGEFAIMVMIALIIIAMSFIYDKHFTVTRNLVLGFASLAILLAVLSFCNIDIPGMPVMLGAIIAACLYVAFEAIHLRRRKLFIATATGLLSVMFMFSVNVAFNYLQPHQQQRVLVAVGIVEDLRGAGYNVNQSKIAIGSGGFWGKGFLNGTQTKLKYVPEQHTDFIFCTIGEEEGFAGALAVTMMFLILILRIITLAERQPTTFGRVYAYCVASYLIFHFCINIGMVIGLCPVIGIPLPFFSYGGSSLWGFTILLFILLRIDANRKMVRR